MTSLIIHKIIEDKRFGTHEAEHSKIRSLTKRLSFTETTDALQCNNKSANELHWQLQHLMIIRVQYGF